MEIIEEDDFSIYNFNSIINYTKDNFFQILLLFLVFFIIYLVDYISNINTMISQINSMNIPQPQVQPQVQVQPQKIKHPKGRKMSKK
jgi:hypothetical protein